MRRWSLADRRDVEKKGQILIPTNTVPLDINIYYNNIVNETINSKIYHTK